MVGIGKAAAIQVGHQRPGTAVAVLSGAVYRGHRLAVFAVQRLYRLRELLGGPCPALQIDILIRSGVHKGVVVDGHARHIHCQRIQPALAVTGKAGGADGLIDLLPVPIVP